MSDYDTTSLDDIINDIKELLGEDPVKPPEHQAQALWQPDPKVRRNPEQVQAPAAQSGSAPDDFDWAAQNFIDDDIGPYIPPVRRPSAPPSSQAVTGVQSQQPATGPEPSGTKTDRSASIAGTSGAGSSASRRRTGGSARPQNDKPAPSGRRQSRRYVDELEQPAGRRASPEAQEREPVRAGGAKKVWKLIKTLIAIALVLAIVLVGAYVIFAEQPIGDGKTLGDRKDGVSTILLAGTDADGTRTDTIMLLNVNSAANTVNLVSIPRDTFVSGGYNVPKINSAYGWAGKGEDGMQELMDRVTETIGFTPDGYLLVDLDSFIELVDLMGGVKFDVPMDMRYSDPAQNLTIDLTAGMQKLDGQQAMGLVRFRSGYAMADLERVNVQRAFVSAAAKQWASVKSVLKIPGLLNWYSGNVTTNLSMGNLAWLGVRLMRADLDSAQTKTLPGEGRTIWGGSYYCLDPNGVLQMVNDLLNPYEQEVGYQDVSIRG